MEYTIDTKQVAELVREGFGTKDIGMAILGQARPAQAFRAWERGADWKLGIAAVGLLQEAVERRRHLRARVTIDRRGVLRYAGSGRPVFGEA